MHARDKKKTRTRKIGTAKAAVKRRPEKMKKEELRRAGTEETSAFGTAGQFRAVGRSSSVADL